MVTMAGDRDMHRFVVDFHERGGMSGIVCHATCVLLDTRKADGALLVDGKTRTGFADEEERFADAYVGRLVTGQQQYSGAATALMLEALGG